MATGFARTQAASPAGRTRVGAGLTGALIVTVLALAVRLATATTQSFWLDEAYTVHLVHLGLGSMLSEIPKSESTPPLYYVLAWGWTRGFGFGELGLRSLSALAGAATVTCAYLIADRLGGRRAAVVAGGLLTVSPLMVWYSQEARAYALAALLAAASLLCLVGYLQSDPPTRTSWAAAWAATAALGLCAHYFVGFVVAAEVVWLLWRARERPQARRAVGFVVVVGMALIPLALAQHGTGHADYIAQGSLGTRALQVPKQFLIGYVSPGQLVTAIVAGLLVLGGAIWPLLRDRRWATPPAQLVLAAGLTCTLVPLGLALVGLDFLDTRNLLPALAPLLIVASVGFASAVARPAGLWLAATLAIVSAAVVLVVNTDVRYQRSDWGGASRALGAARVARAIVVSPGTVLALQAYLPGLRVMGRPQPIRELDIVGIALPVGGSGLALPPRPPPSLAIPAGFRSAGATFTRGYTLRRYRAATPVTVTGPELAPLHPGADGAILAQAPHR